MKLFELHQLFDAIKFAADGGQALYRDKARFRHAARYFREAVARGEFIGHIFDLDRERLVATALKVGASPRVYSEPKDRQHINLFGNAMDAAVELCDE